MFDHSKVSNSASATLITDLYAQCEQSFYLFDLSALQERVAWIRQIVPDRIGLFYSAKANPNLHLIREIAIQFQGIEVASLGEIAAARLAGVDGSRLLFVGPMKTTRDISMAHAAGVRSLVVESMDQLMAVNHLGLYDLQIIVRINPDLKIGSSTIKMAGRPTQFGIDRAALNTVYEFFHAHPKLTLRGYHIYGGTQIENPAVTLSIIREMSEIYFATPDDLRTRIDFLDFGGGFSFPVNDSPVPYPLHDLTNDLQNAVAEIPEKVKLYFELGRFVVAPIGSFCTQVQTLKHSKGENFAICDAGINGFYSFASQSQFKRQNYPVFHIPAPRPNGANMGKFEGAIVGPLCTPADSLAAGLVLHNVSEGDILVFQNCGAYGLTHAMPMFLSHAVPLEIGIRTGEKAHHMLRRNAQLTDSLRAQGASDDDIKRVLG